MINHNNNNDIECRSDIWSLGVTIYVILIHDYPFDGVSDEDLYYNILKTNINESLIPDRYRNLVVSMLRKDPKERISLSDAIKYLKRIESSLKDDE